MNRRVEHNHALAYAIQLGNRLNLPVLFYEGLGCTYPYANDRMHTFLLEGVAQTRRRATALGLGYLFHARLRKSDPNRALYDLASQAAVVVSDDYPVFVAARHNASVSRKLGIPYFVVDSSCIVPMSLMAKREWAAYTIRPKIQRLLPYFVEPVRMERLANPWPSSSAPLPVPDTDTTDIPTLVAACEIDHSVPPSTEFRGGRHEAERRLEDFVARNLARYATARNEPSQHATSNMSPYLHFGHISSLEIALRLKNCNAPEYLEELIVRRELAFNFCRFTEDPTSISNLPDWALKTLRAHDGDEREKVYTREQFEQAATHDALWNATQREMLTRGKIHGYYRMYWGKKIIEWSRTHEEALATMIYLHDRYALDGRDPNTYTNILWCFGLHDRPWTERPVFGQIRWMSLEGMRRKTDVDAYIAEMNGLFA